MQQGIGLEGIIVGNRLLHQYFKIGTKKGTPFPDEPNLEAYFSDSDVDGSGLHLYDRSEKLEYTDRPRLEVRSSIADNERELTVRVGLTIPDEHLLITNKDRIIGLCSQAAKEMGLSFVDRFYLGYDDKKLTKAIAETFTSTVSEVLQRETEVDASNLFWYSYYMNPAEISSYDSFRGQGIKFFSEVGLQASTPERLKILKNWYKLLKKEGFLPKAV